MRTDHTRPPRELLVSDHSFIPSYSNADLCGFMVEGHTWTVMDPHYCRRRREEHNTLEALNSRGREIEDYVIAAAAILIVVALMYLSVHYDLLPVIRTS